MADNPNVAHPGQNEKKTTQCDCEDLCEDEIIRMLADRTFLSCKPLPKDARIFHSNCYKVFNLLYDKTNRMQRVKNWYQCARCDKVMKINLSKGNWQMTRHHCYLEYLEEEQTPKPTDGSGNTGERAIEETNSDVPKTNQQIIETDAPSNKLDDDPKKVEPEPSLNGTVQESRDKKESIRCETDIASLSMFFSKLTHFGLNHGPLSVEHIKRLIPCQFNEESWLTFYDNARKPWFRYPFIRRAKDPLTKMPIDPDLLPHIEYVPPPYTYVIKQKEIGTNKREAEPSVEKIPIISKMQKKSASVIDKNARKSVSKNLIGRSSFPSVPSPLVSNEKSLTTPIPTKKKKIIANKRKVEPSVDEKANLPKKPKMNAKLAKKKVQQIPKDQSKFQPNGMPKKK